MMRYRREIPWVLVGRCLIASPLVLGLAALGQEGAGVEWDPHETRELNLNFTTVLIGLLLALGCVGVWRLLMRQLESRRATIRWAEVRLWWPITMLFWNWVMLAMFAKSESRGLLFDAVFSLFGLLDFPALVLVGLIVSFLSDSFQLSPWLRIGVGSATMWAGNYLTVRFAEWRAWLNAPVALHLVDREAGPRESAERGMPPRRCS